MKAPIYTLLLLFLFILIKEVDADSGSIKDLYPDIFVDNCGLNAYFTITAYFGVTVPGASYDSIVGQRNEKAISFADLESLFQARKLFTHAYADASAEDILSLLNDHSVLIVQLTVGRGSGHFLTVFPAKRLDFYIVEDFPHPPDKVSRSLLLNTLRVKGTGNALVVSNEGNAPVVQTTKSHDQDRPAIDFEETVFASAPLASQNEFEVAVHVTNNSSQPVSVMKATGTCSCFAGLKEAVVIPARTAGQVILIFHTRLFNFLYGTKVFLHTNVPIADYLINVIPPNNAVPRIRLMSKTISLGFCKGPISLVIKLIADSSVKDVSRVTIVNGSDSFPCSLLLENGSVENLFGKKYWIDSVTVQIDSTPKGPFNTILHLKTSHPLDNDLEVNVSGTGI